MLKMKMKYDAKTLNLLWGAMQIKNLKALVKRGESEIMEFKRSTGQLQAAMQTVCAFLNSEVGGTVLIGVTDDGKIIGQEIADKTNRDIANELERIEPHVNISIKRVSVGSFKYVIVVVVKPGKNKPYAFDGRSYIRNQSTTQQMSREEYICLFQENQQHRLSWDIVRIF